MKSDRAFGGLVVKLSFGADLQLSVHLHKGTWGEAREYLACLPASWGRSPSHLAAVLSHSLFKTLGLQMAKWVIMQKWLPFSEEVGRPCENGTCTEDLVHPEITPRCHTTPVQQNWL